MPADIRLTTIIAVLAAVLLTSAAAPASDDAAAGSAAAKQESSPKSGLRVDILEVTVNLERTVTKPLDAARSVAVRTMVSNTLDRPLEVKLSDIQLTCDGTAFSPNPVYPDALLKEDRTLAPGEEIAGWLAFSIAGPVTDEPELTLTWQVNGKTLSWSINGELRRLLNVKTERIGPDNCLAVMTLNDAIDREMIWVLSTAFRELHEAGMRRLVVVSIGESHSPQRGVITSWLATARIGNEEMRLPTGPQPRSPVQFPVFHAAGFGNSTGNYRVGRRYRNSGGSTFLHPDRERAVAAALQDLYQRQPVDTALAGLQSSEPGIRRAALSTSIDRLTPEQLRQVIADVASAPASQQALVAELLSQVAYPGVVESLRNFVLSSDAEVSQAALNSLVQCLSPETDRVVHEIWLTSVDNAGFRERIVNEMLSADDDRWSSYVRETAELLLDRAARSASEPPSSADSAEPKDPPDEAPDKPVAHAAPADSKDTPAPLSRSESQLLQRTLAFFEEHEEPGFVHFARARVLEIHEPETQDRVLEFLLAFNDPTDAELARQYIDLRLPHGTTSDRLIAVVTQFPDKRYTERLLELSKNASLRSSVRNNLMTAAIHCATGRQLDPLIEDFNGLDDSAQTLLLQQLAASNHPRWLELAESTLGKNPARDGAVLRIMGANPSPESLNLLLRLLEQTRLRADSEEEFDRKEAGYAQNLIAQVSTFSHPEAKRILNRCYISRSSMLRGQAKLAIQRSLQKSPGIADYIRMSQATDQRQYSEALEAASDAIAKDPFMADALHSRASLYLRDNRIGPALRDLEESIRLQPEDIVAESTLAIARIRSGDVAAGLEYADEILSRVPEEAGDMRWITLYNTACAYARTDEVPGISDEKREQYLDRAVDLFSRSIESGFGDVGHVLNDPDLDALHNRPEWESLLRTMAEVAKRPKEPKEE
ncbi:MAG: hypothetical protein R3C19_13655 [Planctomycetaceae bacterium]